MEVSPFCRGPLLRLAPVPPGSDAAATEEAQPAKVTVENTGGQEWQEPCVCSEANVNGVKFKEPQAKERRRVSEFPIFSRDEVPETGTSPLPLFTGSLVGTGPKHALPDELSCVSGPRQAGSPFVLHFLSPCRRLTHRNLGKSVLQEHL